MIRTAPRTDVSLSALALAALLVAGLSAGFVAGQVAPDVVSAIGNNNARPSSIHLVSKRGE